MRLNNRRISSNVEDRRGMKGGAKAGMGIGGLIIIGLLTWILGGNPLSVISESGSDIMGSISPSGSSYTPTQEEEQLAEFSKKILQGQKMYGVLFLSKWVKFMNLQL